VLGIGDTAVALIKAGAELDKKDMDGNLALDLAPDKAVCRTFQAETAAFPVGYEETFYVLTLSHIGPEVYRAGVRERRN